MNGELGWEEFLKFLLDFLEISNRIGDGWRACGVKDVYGGTYAVKREERLGKKVDEHNLKDEFEESHLEESLEDSSAVTLGKNIYGDRQFWEYHIVYSVSYSVPVLYFNAWRENGELLTLEEIWSEIPSSIKPSTDEQYWNLISQQEHPLLGRPFFQVHPCQTSNLITNIKVITGERILISWLSSVGPLVNLNLSSLYAINNAKRIKL